MIITYFRSSSYNNWDLCQQQYFLKYVLGWPDGSGKAAEMGTIVHKVMEILAVAKLKYQQNQFEFDDDSLGKLEFSESELFSDTWMEFIYNLSYDYYVNKSVNTFTLADKRKCLKWCYTALTYLNGDFDPRKRKVIAAEPHFDIELPYDWAKYKYEINGEVIEGRLCIKGTIDMVLESSISPDIYESVDWKGLPLNTKLPTPYGWTTMEDIQLNDTVFDQYGNQCNVIGKSKIKTKKCYKIYFDDTTSVICDDEHLWKLSNGETVSVKDLNIGDKINVTKPLVIDDTDLPIDPYVLGVWLGDSRNRNGEISNNDSSIFTEIQKRGYTIGKNIEHRKNGCPSHTIYGLTTQLKKLGLLHNKHIPKEYLRSSINQRIDLLRGLMDSDGNVNTCRKQAVFRTCNQELSNNTKELLISLGQRPNQVVIKKKTNFTNDKYINVYPLHFKPININPFLLKRKKEQIKIEWGTGKPDIRQIVSIKSSIIQKTQCIMVDSNDNTYLCTENMIPTHNTGKCRDFATGVDKDYKSFEKDPQLHIYHYALHNLFPDVQQFVPTIYWINNEGAFTMPYGPNDLSRTEEILKKRFREIRDNNRPKLIKGTKEGWKCRTICDFGKKQHPSGEINPYTGEVHTMCSWAAKKLKEKGMKRMVEEHKEEGHEFNKYHAPGA